MPAAKKPAEPISVKEVAGVLGVEPRALRAFLRRTGQAAGRGARYSFDAAAVKAITKAWQTEQVAASAAGPSEETETTDAA